MAVEYDAAAVQTFNTNFPDVPVHDGDIAALSVERVIDMTGLQRGELDVFDGSPPCQGFSTAGKRQPDDPRNQLYRHYIRLVEGLNPRVCVMENVSGMVRGPMKAIFVDIVQSFRGLGYTVSARVLDAKTYGVPHQRNRLILIASRDGLTPSHPSPLNRYVRVLDALTDVENDEAERKMLLAAGQKYAMYKRWPFLKPGETYKSAYGIGQDDGRKIHPYRVSPIIPAFIGNISLSGLMHWQEQRRPTTAELKRLASFPDQFIFPHEFPANAKQIGNCVPPLFMAAIARHIRDTLLAEGGSNDQA